MWRNGGRGRCSESTPGFVGGTTSRIAGFSPHADWLEQSMEGCRTSPFGEMIPLPGSGARGGHKPAASCQSALREIPGSGNQNRRCQTLSLHSAADCTPVQIEYSLRRRIPTGASGRPYQGNVAGWALCRPHRRPRREEEETITTQVAATDRGIPVDSQGFHGGRKTPKSPRVRAAREARVKNRNDGFRPSVLKPPRQIHHKPLHSNVLQFLEKFTYFTNVSLIHYCHVNVLHDDELETTPANERDRNLTSARDLEFRKRDPKHGWERQTAVLSRPHQAPILSSCRELCFPVCSARKLPFGSPQA